MSRFCIIPRRAIEDERFSMSHLRVLAALGSFADRNGWCFPSTSTIAVIIGVSRQRVSLCVSDLREWGYLEVHRRTRPTDLGQTSNGYRVLFDVGEPEGTPATTDCGGVQPLEVAGGATSGGCAIKDPIKDPSLSGASPTEAGRACLLMREAGIVLTNPSHPALLAALAEGVTPEVLADTAREHPGKGMPYVITVARRRHAEPTAKPTGGNHAPARPLDRQRGESLAEYSARINRYHDEREERERTTGNS